MFEKTAIKTEMKENEFLRRSDRSYLCLVAIYVIHALLLNVFLQPQLRVTSGVTLDANYVRRSTEHSGAMDRNESKILIIRREVGASPIINSTSNLERRSMEVNDDEYNGESSSDGLFYQSKSGGAAIRFLTGPTYLGILRIAANALDNARQLVKSLSPAALGIISGCFVFLLTFTDNVPSDQNKEDS